MSKSDDSQNTRPISVAELLARNGTIGAPPSGGRRHRRRGNADAISVSELTAEIPVIRDEPAPEPVAVEPEAEEFGSDESDIEESDIEESAAEESAAEESAAEEPAAEESAAEEPEAVEEDVDEAEDAAEVVDEPDEPDEPEEAADVVDDAEAVVEVVDEPEAVVEVVDEPEAVVEVVDEPEAVVEDVDEPEAEEAEPDAEPEQVDGPLPLSEEPVPSRESGPVRGDYPRPRIPSGAEEMAPDPVDESIDLDELLAAQGEDPEELRTYLQASSGALFSGETMADDIARRGPVTEVITEFVPEAVPESLTVADRGGRFGGVRYALAAVLQSVLAVLFGAGLFLGFDQLWRWNTIVALVLSVLVILGLVIAVRVVRKTEDIGSTLIAVAVGALVTLGPLALLQST